MLKLDFSPNWLELDPGSHATSVLAYVADSLLAGGQQPGLALRRFAHVAASACCELVEEVRSTMPTCHELMEERRRSTTTFVCTMPGRESDHRALGSHSWLALTCFALPLPGAPASRHRALACAVLARARSRHRFLEEIEGADDEGSSAWMCRFMG